MIVFQDKKWMILRKFWNLINSFYTVWHYFWWYLLCTNYCSTVYRNADSIADHQH
jgi:hypothetical protein